MVDFAFSRPNTFLIGPIFAEMASQVLKSHDSHDSVGANNLCAARFETDEIRYHILLNRQEENFHLLGS